MTAKGAAIQSAIGKFMDFTVVTASVKEDER
jgi:hypothetical protein